MQTKETSFTFCSELPPGTYAGVVVKEEVAEPPTICLYHEQGVKYTDTKSEIEKAYE